jgi:formylglycine-generating enzyme required for sulfatase activity
LEGEQGPAFIQLYDFYLNKFKELATYSFMSLDSSGHNKFFEFAYEINRIDLIGKYLALIFQSRIKGEEYCANFYAVEDIYQLTHPVPEPVEPFNRKKAVKKFRQQFPDEPQIGDEFSDTLKDGSRGPAMVVLPMGSFHMGSNYGEYDEQPIHRVTISQPIAMMKYEVTYDDWDKCDAAEKCYVGRQEHNGGGEGWGRGNRPLINVTMENVKNYALWLSEQTSKR